MTNGLEVVTAGRLYCDLVFTGLDAPPTSGHEVFAEDLHLRTGGGAFITAAYLARLGHDAALFATLPAAPFTDRVIADAELFGLRLHGTAPGAGTAPQITVAFPLGGDRSFVTKRVGPALPDIATMPRARHLHIGEMTTALEHPDLIGAARRAGMTISLDCAWDGIALKRNDLGEVIAAVDLFFPNADEVAELARQGVEPRPRQALVTKRGADGAEYRPASGPTLHAPARPARIRDLTGAGDAFNAGFLSAWLRGAAPQRALQEGTRLGAIAIAEIGGIAPDTDVTAADQPPSLQVTAS
ncbi:MAG: carbohydrate kinase family protein [Roseicyclus sp.]